MDCKLGMVFGRRDTGNGGTANVQKTTNVNISSSDFDALVAFSVKNNVRQSCTDF